MAPKPPPKAAAAPPPPPAPVVEGDPLDEYSEGEEEDIPKSKIKVEIVAATGVWGIESGEDKSKIAFDIQFPEEPPPPPPNPADPPVEIQSFLPDIEPIPKGVWPLPPPPPDPTPPPDQTLNSETLTPDPPPPPANFNFSFVREYERTPSYHLCNKLVQEQMVITVHWISPSGASKAPIATAKVNLAALIPLNKCTLTTVAPLAIYEEPVAAPPPAAANPKGAKAPPPPKKGAPPPPPAAPPPPAEEKPKLLEGATLKVLITTSEPLVTEADRNHGFVLEVDVVTIRQLPAKVQEYGCPPEGMPQPFVFTVGFTIPGFTPESTVGPRELKKLLFGGEEVKPDCSIERLEVDEWGYPPVIQEMQNIVVWTATGVKRYLPGQASYILTYEP